MSLSYISGSFQYLLQKIPRFRSNAMKRSAIAAVSIAGIITLVATALYLKRKRQKKFPKQKEIDAVRRTKRRYGKNKSSTAASSPSSIKAFRHHRRKNSYTASVTSSAASSSRSRRRRQRLMPNSDDVTEVEKLYQEGVDSFESALEKWEKATNMLQSTTASKPTEMNARKSLDFPLSDKKPDASKEMASLRNERIRTFSLNNTRSPSQLNSGFGRSESFSISRSSKKLNNNYCSQSDSHLDELLNGMKLDSKNNESITSFEEQLQSIVQRAQHLQEAFDYVLYDDSDTGSDTDMTLTGFDEDQISDTESNESFVSARESWETHSVDSHPRRLYMYEQALEAVERGEVRCRASRSDLLDCFSEDEFLAKLHCVRQGFEVMLQDITVREWLIETGRSMIECILCAAERNIEEFQQAFSCMIDYTSDNDNWGEIEDELRGRKVVQMTFYDIVLDFLLMDAFEDLESPPGTVLAIIQNRWLANSLKESALSAAVWSVLKAKRSRLKYKDGFVAHLYDISTCVTPALAWGFMGPEGKLKSVCLHFKKEIVDFLGGLFSFEHVRYTTPVQMADDILRLTRDRFGSLMQFLQHSNNDIANGDDISV